jgi:hypothetical protein
VAVWSEECLTDFFSGPQQTLGQTLGEAEIELSKQNGNAKGTKKWTCFAKGRGEGHSAKITSHLRMSFLKKQPTISRKRSTVNNPNVCQTGCILLYLKRA